MFGVNDLLRFEFAIQHRQCAARAGMLQIVRETIFQCLAFFSRIIDHLTHPIPGFSQHIVVIAHVHGAVQIAARAFTVSRLGIDNATA